MKNRVIVLLLVINIILMGIVYNLLNPNERLVGEKQILKEMSTSEREQELDNKITELSTSATEYATYVQSCKTQIANAITERGVSTNETDTIDIMVENIKKLGSLNIIAQGGSGSHRDNPEDSIHSPALVPVKASFVIPENIYNIRLYFIEDPDGINVVCNGYVSASEFITVANPHNGNHDIIMKCADLVVEPGDTITLKSTVNSVGNIIYWAIEI